LTTLHPFAFVSIFDLRRVNFESWTFDFDPWKICPKDHWPLKQRAYWPTIWTLMLVAGNKNITTLALKS